MISCTRMVKKPTTSNNMGGVWESQIGSTTTILNSLLKIHGVYPIKPCKLEVEAIVNSTHKQNDVTSLVYLRPVNLLTIKSKVVMSSPNNFKLLDW